MPLYSTSSARRRGAAPTVMASVQEIEVMADQRSTPIGRKTHGQVLASLSEWVGRLVEEDTSLHTTDEPFDASPLPLPTTP